MLDHLNFKKVFIGGVAVVGLLTGLSACETIHEGHLGLQNARIGRALQDDLLPEGVNLTLNTVREIVVSQIPVDMKDLKPKDKNDVQLKDMDLTVIYRLKRDNEKAIVSYIRDTTDIKQNEKGNYVVGMRLVESETRSSIQTAMHEFTSRAALADQNKLEGAIKAQIQKDIDVKYPGVLEIVDVKTYSLMVSDSIEQQIQGIEKLNAINAQNAAEKASLASQKELDLLKWQNKMDISRQTGVPLSVIQQQDLIDVAKNGKGNTIIFNNGGGSVVPSGPK